MADVKFLIGELNGTEFDSPTEYVAESSDIIFNPIDNIPLGTVRSAIQQANIFGSYYQAASNQTETSTTSITVFLNQVTLNTVSVPTGSYRLSWRFRWRASGATRRIDVRVRANGVAVQTMQYHYSSTEENPLIVGYLPINLTDGLQTFTLDYKMVSGNSSVSIFMSQANLEIWRVS